MDLIIRVKTLLDQLTEHLSEISPAQFSEPVTFLQQGTVGQHVRHIIEMYEEMLMGYETGIIDYANRKRDKVLETDPVKAIFSLKRIPARIALEEKALRLLTETTIEGHSHVEVVTSFQREILYNIEHTIHHMALIRIVFEHRFNKVVPPDFGVAFSTLQYRRTCAP